jgi:hypothetical protein
MGFHQYSVSFLVSFTCATYPVDLAVRDLKDAEQKL